MQNMSVFSLCIFRRHIQRHDFVQIHTVSSSEATILQFAQPWATRQNPGMRINDQGRETLGLFFTKGPTGSTSAS